LSPVEQASPPAGRRIARASIDGSVFDRRKRARVDRRHGATKKDRRVPVLSSDLVGGTGLEPVTPAV
jgi:hypothetical protein